MDKHTDEALSGIRVLEYAQFVSGPYCGKLLADLGAEVIKIEPPEGDRARLYGPFLNDIRDKETSGLFLYLNTNKLGITLNPESQAGCDSFRMLAKEADILLFDAPPVLAVADASLLATKLDGVLLVVSAGQTKREHARLAVERLSKVNAHIVGSVLNNVALDASLSSYLS